ncbi:Uu.00g049240.m01.CDS01 [Anthostomella pinea]|uniref:Uu.00g049240.m01.CDS01 n=1 Tax=Anthostomella pinea TaxID=933095 RepID=A0AAI8VBX1_9PEZI|nr:Uu.00g049240.m01.CDS01 [Anthostomella pinea]
MEPIENVQGAQDSQGLRKLEQETWQPPSIATPALPLFEYDTLPTSGIQKIRLIKILPHSDDSCPVEAELTTHDVASAPHYTALSYTWGDVATFPIVLNRRLAHVRSNLLSFMLGADPETLYWVDAICIDQQNIPERSEVVSRMKNIYERAQGIVVWLGTVSPETASSFVALDAFSNMHVFDLFKDRKRERYVPKDGEDAHTRPDLPVLKERLLEHPYWHCIWILQEASTPIYHKGPYSSTSVWYADRKHDFLNFLFGFLTLTNKRKERKENIGIH